MLDAYRLGTAAREQRGEGGEEGGENEGWGGEAGEGGIPHLKRGLTVTSSAVDMHHQLGELNLARWVLGEGTQASRKQRAF
jgi:hypothetical protein